MTDNAERDKKFAAMIKDRCMSGDQEADHSDADDLLCVLLAELGFTETLQAYGKVGKWYA